MDKRAWAAGLAAALMLPFGPAVLAQAPVFAWASPQPAAAPVPPRFFVVARFAAGEELQRYYTVLPAGATETLEVLTPPGVSPPEVTVLAPDGSEFSLPALPAAQRVWLGPVPLERVVAYPYQSQQAGAYGLIVQAADPSTAAPYAVAGDWQGGEALAPSGAASFLLLPVTWLRALVWRL